MTVQSFDQVFQKLSLSVATKEAFCATEVTSLTIFKKERTVVLDIVSPRLISFHETEQFKKELSQSLPGIKEVKLSLKYRIDNYNDHSFMTSYWDNIKAYISQQSKICSGIMSDADWNYADEKLIIYVKNNMAYYMAQKKFDTDLVEMIKQETGQTLAIQFKNTSASEKEMEVFEQKKEARANDFLEKIVAAQEAVEQEKSAAEVAGASDSVQKGILFGKECVGVRVSISDSKTVGEAVVIEGNIFNIETREIKGEKYIVSFDITDKTDSTTVKFFVKKNIYDSELQKHLKTGACIRAQGDVQFDKYAKEINIMAKNINMAKSAPPRMDHSQEKRVELHLHTQMSSMDGITPVKNYIQCAIDWGHKAIAITDHGVVQAFPDAMNAASKSDLKVIYGIEAYLIDDLGSVVSMSKGQNLDDAFVVFDIETTGLSKETERITEIGAVKLVNGKIVDRFSSFVNPEKSISQEITKITGITDEMVADAPKIQEVLPAFLKFAKDAVLVAHNASFDMGFIRVAAERYCSLEVEHTVLDTLELARTLLPELNKHKLNIICEHLDISLVGHHRAVNDAEATAEMFMKFIDR
ncbi:MAG: exonuclease domain-containing protein [Anaerotignum sp.]